MAATSTGARRSRLPALFLGHGSPMNAIEDNEYHRSWRAIAERIPRPRAVLCVSAHWETDGVAVTASERPETIHDFGGFPRALHEFEYPAPGDPAFAREVAELVESARVRLDPRRGLDHGAWSVLCAMYPQADVPVVQLSLDAARAPLAHHALGRELAPLRERGVLLLGAGNIVHNLRYWLGGRAPTPEWATRFDAEIKRRIAAGDDDGVVDWRALGEDAELSVPTPEHYLPLLYVLGARDPGERVEFATEKVEGPISMTSVLVGA